MGPTTGKNPNTVEKLTIRNNEGDIRETGIWLARISEARGFSEKTRFALDLVLNEVLINVVQYGFEHETIHQINIMLEELPTGVRVLIDDDGVPFNPLKQHVPEPSNDLDKAWGSGRGVLLVRQYCRDMEYQNRNGRNFLSLTVAKDP